MREGNVMVNTKTNKAADTRGMRRDFIPLSIYKNNQESLTFDQSQNLVLMIHQWLSPCLVDSLAEAQQNWINLLEPHWLVEVYSLNLLGVTHETNSLKHCDITIAEIVKLTSQAQYQHFVVAHQPYYCYTCCLHIAGLGRVRLVIAFDNPERTGNYGVLLTNGLAWSPQTILSRWLEKYPLTLLFRSQMFEQQSNQIKRLF
jgi:hypothetical protein